MKTKRENAKGIFCRVAWTFAVVLFVMIGTAATCFADNVQIYWNPNPEQDIAGYKVYYKADSSQPPFDGAGAVQGIAPIDVGKQTSATITGLDPGSDYYFAVTAYNTSGLESDYSAIVGFPGVKDTIPPAISVISPVSGASVSGVATITATATDDIGVTKIELYVNDALVAGGNVSPFSYNWDTSSLPSGSYTLTAKAYDAAGNTSTSSVAATVDNVVPAVALVTPAPTTTVSRTIIVSATAKDNIGVAKVAFYLNGIEQWTSTTGPYNFSWDTLKVANGSYTLFSRAYDVAGNIGQSADVTVTVFNDTIAPTVSISSPVDGSTTGGTVTVAANASDDVAVTRVEWYLNGALQATSTTAPYSFKWNTTALANGSYSLIAKAYDAAGNVGQSSNMTINVFNDSTAPTVSIGSPSANSTAAALVTVSANATDNVGVTRVEFYVNGALQAASTSAPYSFNWNTTVLANGSHTLSAKAYDAAGNVGQSSEVTVNVLNDTTPPTIKFLAPTSNYIHGTSVSVSASATDNVAVAKMELYIDGSLKNTTTSSSFNIGYNFAMGVHTIMVKAYDQSNNVTTSSMSVYRFQ